MGERQPPHQLSLDGYEFHRLDASELSWPVMPPPGLWSWMITLAEIFGNVQDLNRIIAAGSVDER